MNTEQPTINEIIDDLTYVRSAYSNSDGLGTDDGESIEKAKLAAKHQLLDHLLSLPELQETQVRPIEKYQSEEDYSFYISVIKSNNSVIGDIRQALTRAILGEGEAK